LVLDLKNLNPFISAVVQLAPSAADQSRQMKNPIKSQTIKHSQKRGQKKAKPIV